MSNDLVQVLQIILLVSGGFLLLGQMVFSPKAGTTARKAMLGLVAVTGLLGVFAYSKFGKFHDYGGVGKHTFHYHDIWHYALGAKYYPEVGYDGIYDCTAVALDEMRADGIRVPRIKEVRVLADPMDHYVLAPKLPELREVCHERFSASRWETFKEDQAAWLDVGFTDRWWRVMLFDLGFNPPPSWNVLAHSILDVVPLTPTTLEVLPFIDIALILLLGGALVWWAWGPFALGGYLLVFGTNYAANYAWTGGSYCRQLWFAALVAGLAFLSKKYWKTAGAILALSACMRVFPAVFIAGAGLAVLGMAWRGECTKRDVAEFTGAGVATGIVLVGASLLLFDPAYWADFFHKIDEHGATYFVWHIGFKKWATWGPGVAGQDFWYGPGLARFQDWNAMLSATWDNNRLFFNGLRLTMIAAAAGMSLTMKPARAGLFLGGTLMFCLTIPANYYYVWLALIPAVFFEEDADWPATLRMFGLFAMLTTFSAVKWYSGDALIQNSFWNTAAFWFFSTWILTTAFETAAVRSVVGRLWTERKREVAAVTLAAVAIVSAARLIDFDSRKNLVVILMDTTRADRFGTYGHPRSTTPRIDAFAEQSTVFEHAYSHAPWTAPSVASIMTSMVPRDHGLVDWDMTLDAKHLTLAEHLEREGYQTMAAISHVVFREALGFNQGFDKYNTRALKLGHPERTISSKVVTDVAINQLKRRDPSQPFFLWTHYFDPHFQYQDHKDFQFVTPEAQRRLPRMTQWSNTYDSEIAFTDHHVGRLLSFLDKQGLTEDTVIALVADHGEEFGDHGGERHSVQMWDEVVRVPLIIRAPGVAPGRFPQVVPTSDLAPTVLPLLGVPTPDSFKGRAIEATAEGFVRDGHRPVILETIRFADKRAWVRWPWKLVQDRKANTITLYNLQEDPKERRDVAARHPDVREELLAEIAKHYEVDRAQAPSREITDEERAQLEALGYVEEEDE